MSVRSSMTVRRSWFAFAVSLAALAGAAVLAAPSEPAPAPPASPASPAPPAPPAGDEPPPVDTAALYAQGKEALEAKQFARAEELFRKAFNAKPNDADITNMHAYALRKVGRLEDARRQYLRALKLRPDFPQCREYLGECYLEMAREQLDELRKGGAATKTYHDALAAAFQAAAQGVAGTGSGEIPVKSW